jgi:peptidoglycan/xylan/chitin deacetylase (PgdA/CDA1 family)
MHISHRHFEAIVDSLRELGELVPLDELVTRHLRGQSTIGLVAFTADDAYASWLDAEPLLVRLKVPLTIFAVNDAIASGGRFWWDRIDEVVAQSPPDRWRRFECDCGLPDVYRRGPLSGEGAGKPLRQWILAERDGRWPAALEPFLAEVEKELACFTPQRSMTEKELAGFLARTGSQLGVHTISHAALPFLRDEELLQEIRQSYGQLRDRFAGALPYLAIPFGLYDARTLRIASEAGMSASLTLQGQALDWPYSVEVGVPRVCVVREQRPGILALKASALPRFGQSGRRQYGSFPDLPSATS